MDPVTLERARAGDEQAFAELTGPYRRELQVLCYRLLGSLTDAEDALQETLLAAWRGLPGFAGRASLRTWLYRIATNQCLNARRAAHRRLPAEPVPPFQPPEPTQRDEITWLQPIPDALLDAIADPAPGPDARCETTEAIELAFVAGLQRMPPRQAATLVLRDVLDRLIQHCGVPDQAAGPVAGQTDDHGRPTGRPDPPGQHRQPGGATAVARNEQHGPGLTLGGITGRWLAPGAADNDRDSERAGADHGQQSHPRDETPTPHGKSAIPDGHAHCMTNAPAAPRIKEAFSRPRLPRGLDRACCPPASRFLSPGTDPSASTVTRPGWRFPECRQIGHRARSRCSRQFAVLTADVDRTQIDEPDLADLAAFDQAGARR